MWGKKEFTAADLALFAHHLGTLGYACGCFPAWLGPDTTPWGLDEVCQDVGGAEAALQCLALGTPYSANPLQISHALASLLNYF